MTCGAGLYLEATTATVIVLLALQFVGVIEFRIGWHRYPMIYEVRADVGAMLPKDVVGVERAQAMAENVELSLHRMQTAILKVLDAAGQRMSIVERDNVAGLERMAFSVTATQRVHTKLLKDLRESDVTDQVVAFRDVEEE
jgi:putative Mg2+ transporter-C (MgtC) family protein